LSGAGAAGILIERDGSVTILSSRLDVGLNAESTYCDIAADTLGVLPEVVHFRIMEDPGFFLMSPDGSCNLCNNGYVIRKAAKRTKARLLRMATGVGNIQAFHPSFPIKPR
jgi:xanthine dehydrogenase molybdenum-binding subunit